MCAERIVYGGEFRSRGIQPQNVRLQQLLPVGNLNIRVICFFWPACFTGLFFATKDHPMMRRHNPLFFAASMFTLLGALGQRCPVAEAQELQVQAFQFKSSADGEEGADGAGLAEGIAGGMSIAVGGPDGVMSLGGPLGGVDPNNRSQLFDLLSNGSIRRELKLTDPQLEGVRSIMRESSKRMQEYVRAAMAAGDGKINLDIGQLMKEKRAEAELAIEEILLPEQLGRLRQLAYQIEVATDGLGESLVNGRLGRDVGVYEDQKQHLTDRAEVIEAELRVAIAKAHAAARAKLFAELTPDQRKQADALLGEYFQYEQPNLKAMLREQTQAKDQAKDQNKSQGQNKSKGNEGKPAKNK